MAERTGVDAAATAFHDMREAIDRYLEARGWSRITVGARVGEAWVIDYDPNPPTPPGQQSGGRRGRQ